MVACQSCITEYNKREKEGKKNDLGIIKYKKKSSVENEEKKKEAAQKIKGKRSWTEWPSQMGRTLAVYST